MGCKRFFKKQWTLKKKISNLPGLKSATVAHEQNPPFRLISLLQGVVHSALWWALSDSTSGQLTLMVICSLTPRLNHRTIGGAGSIIRKLSLLQKT